MKKTIALLLCMLVLMLLPFAHAESCDASQVKLTILENCNVEDSQDFRLYIAYEGPHSSGWNIVNSAGNTADFSGSQYHVVSWPAQENQDHTIFHITLPSTDDLSLVLNFKDDSGNTNTLSFPIAEMDECASPEARAEYGIYDFGNFSGYITEAFISTKEPTAELQIRIKPLLFSDTADYRYFAPADYYTNAAEQFEFYAKNGTPLNEALQCAEYEIKGSFGSVSFCCSVQSSGKFDDDAIKKMIAENFGYIKYTYDNGEAICPYIQNTAYYRGNGEYERVDTQMQ